MSFSATPQIIDGYDIDQRRLMELLKRVYGTNQGENKFRVELRLNRYKIYPSEDVENVPDLTEEQIQDCRIHQNRR